MLSYLVVNEGSIFLYEFLFKFYENENFRRVNLGKFCENVNFRGVNLEKFYFLCLLIFRLLNNFIIMYLSENFIF